MALIPGCDIYPGRTKGVRKYDVLIVREDLSVIERQPKTETRLVDRTMHLCPAGEKRMLSFCNRGTQPPPMAKADES